MHWYTHNKKGFGTHNDHDILLSLNYVTSERKTISPVQRQCGNVCEVVLDSLVLLNVSHGRTEWTTAVSHLHRRHTIHTVVGYTCDLDL